jgi:hypothetical protein
VVGAPHGVDFPVVDKVVDLIADAYDPVSGPVVVDPA